MKFFRFIEDTVLHYQHRPSDVADVCSGGETHGFGQRINRAAKAVYYPIITLGATGGFKSGVISTLLTGPSALWSVGGSAIAPIFDAGRRRANLDHAIAAYDQTVANYRETVLTGFQQVEDNLAALRILENEAQVQQSAAVAAQKYLELANTRYVGGVTSYQSQLLKVQLSRMKSPP